MVREIKPEDPSAVLYQLEGDKLYGHILTDLNGVFLPMDLDASSHNLIIGSSQTNGVFDIGSDVNVYLQRHTTSFPNYTSYGPNHVAGPLKVLEARVFTEAEFGRVVRVRNRAKNEYDEERDRLNTACKYDMEMLREDRDRAVSELKPALSLLDLVRIFQEKKS
jgi:hypothetical protein